MSSANLIKKTSPSKEVTLYLAQRDFLDHYKIIDPIDGVVIVPPSLVSSRRRLMVEIHLNFRYGAEADEFSKVSFLKNVVLAAVELFPNGNNNNEKNKQQMNNWQSGLLKKSENIQGVCPFTLEFPQGSPPSLMVAAADTLQTVGGKTCSITYQVVAFWCNDPNEPLINRDTVRLGVRVLQESLPDSVLEQLSLMPVTRPAALVSRQFLLSPGRVQIEMCLDKGVCHFGEKMGVNVVITNTSNRTIRKIKCKMFQVSQLSSCPGEKRTLLNCLETTDGCPLTPGSCLQRSYSLMTKLQPHRTKENLVFEDPLRGELNKMSATTIFPYTDPKEGFAILVSYEIKVKVYLGTVDGDVSARVPFILLHPLAVEINADGPKTTKVPATKPPRMIRLISVEDTIDRQDEPLISW